MELTIKSIINDLFEAKISYQSIEVTAIGETKDEATQNALKWLKRELEILSKSTEEIESLEIDSQELVVKQTLSILKGEEWKQREREIQLMAIEVRKIAMKTAVQYAVKASIGGVVGLIL